MRKVLSPERRSERLPGWRSPRKQPLRIVQQTAGTHRIEHGESLRMFHADPHRSISAHGMSGEPLVLRSAMVR